MAIWWSEISLVDTIITPVHLTVEFICDSILSMMTSNLMCNNIYPALWEQIKGWIDEELVQMFLNITVSLKTKL